jgi:hypothetical protein
MLSDFGLMLTPSSSQAILQVKNRLSPQYNSAASAGYRNVSISLVVVDHFTMALHVDSHVCELQLGIKQVDDLKKAGGHANYVQWRDAKAE